MILRKLNLNKFLIFFLAISISFFVSLAIKNTFFNRGFENIMLGANNVHLSDYCTDSSPNLLKYFDTTIAPPLLFYSYIPIIIISLLLSIFLFKKDRKSLQSKLLLCFTISFSLWILNIIVQWIGVPNNIILFSWQLTAFFELAIYFIAIYFSLVYSNQGGDVSRFVKILLTFAYSCFIVFLPSTLNIASYDAVNCQGNLGLLWTAIYSFEILTILIITFIIIKKWKNFITKSDRNKHFLPLYGINIFLLIFTASNILGEVTKFYEINLIGPIGMVFFLVFILYIVVYYDTFNTHLINSQVLVYVLWILVGSLIFVNKTNVIHIIVIITFLLLLFLGRILIKSIKKEIAQKERLEVLTENLEEANEKLKSVDKLKSEFLSLASHQIRSPLTAIKGYSSMVLDGDFGPIGDKAKEAVDRIFKSSQNLTVMVEDFLNVSKIEQGGMKYTKENFDLGEVAGATARDLSITAEKKGLVLNYSQDNFNHTVFGDKEKIRQVILNFIDNSIKYTKQGSINVSLTSENGKVIFAVKDTGMGMTPEIKATLFQKFSRGEGAKMNTSGSGLGLYLAKEIIAAHSGRVWVESAGPDQGSTFFVELSVATV